MRLLQAMAGGPQGGAEAFFERLAVSLTRRGLAQRLLIRRDAARAHRLRAAGLDVVELPFKRPGSVPFDDLGVAPRQLAIHAIVGENSFTSHQQDKTDRIG